MKLINPVGVASCLTPGTRGSSGTYPVDVYLMTGDIPASDALINVVSAADMLTKFPTMAYKFTGLSITTNYAYNINQRTYKKTPIDALPFYPTINGDIKWAAIVFAGEKILYTDSIGLWDSAEACITLNSLTADTTKENILKDISLVIRDKSTYELYPNGIFNPPAQA